MFDPVKGPGHTAASKTYCLLCRNSKRVTQAPWSVIREGVRLSDCCILTPPPFGLTHRWRGGCAPDALSLSVTKVPLAHPDLTEAQRAEAAARHEEELKARAPGADPSVPGVGRGEGELSSWRVSNPTPQSTVPHPCDSGPYLPICFVQLGRPHAQRRGRGGGGQRSGFGRVTEGTE